jgi:hypothetical protein
MSSAFTALREAAQNTARDLAIKQIPDLIQKYQPQIESSLRSSLTTLKETDVEASAIFFQNWKKIDAVVNEVLGNVGGRRKRTRRHKRKTRKH